MTFGFSRDDVEGRMMSTYLELGLLKRNPFETIDKTGVGELVRIGVQRGRSTNPSLKLGVCGEHGGDPESIDLFYDAGLDYVSCSPFRVPIARLAAAQAAIARSTPARPVRKNAARPTQKKKAAPAVRKATKKAPPVTRKVTKKAAPARTRKAPTRSAPARKAPARKATATKATATKVTKKAAPARKRASARR
jgi:pyruvate,orthophosphate dikinase